MLFFPELTLILSNPSKNEKVFLKLVSLLPFLETDFQPSTPVYLFRITYALLDVSPNRSDAYDEERSLTILINDLFHFSGDLQKVSGSNTLVPFNAVEFFKKFYLVG